MNRYRLLWLLGLMLLAACSQAGNPTPAGTGLAGGGGAGGGGTGGGTTVTALISSGSALLTKFPGMARLQLSITGPAGVAGIPLQLNLPTGGQALPLTLPVGVPLTFTFDVFGSTGAYLGTGTSTLTLATGVNPVIPVNVNPVAPGTPYTDPITGLTGTGPVLSLTVSVMTGASQQPIAGAVVSLGASGAVTATTDASGVASFAGVPMPQDVHVFANSDGVSVLAFQGSALAVPMPENGPLPASVNVSPAGPTLAAGELLDIYLTDGISVQAIGGAIGDTLSLRTSPAINPMRGPVGISAMIENPLDVPRVDRGLSLSSAAGHHIVSPLNTAIADPYVQPRLGLQPLHISVAPVTGLSPLTYVNVEVFAVQAAGLYQFVSHKENGILPANQRDIGIWPVAANVFVEHVLASDSYAQSEVWQRASTASALTAPTAYPPVPAITAASAASVSWSDSAVYTWHGFTVQLDQGLHRWLIYGLQVPFTLAHGITLPIVPVAAVNPLTAGIPATAQVDEYVLDSAAGFTASSPDLWYLPRMLNKRARSATFPFTP